jgi:hypothetical protein
MKTFAACFCIIALFVVVIWESNVTVEQSAEIQKLNLIPKEITTCVEDENVFHIIHVEFNDDTTKDLKYGLTSYRRYEFNKNDCKILHTHLNHKNPNDAHFGINEFDKETCEKIKAGFRICDVKY